MQRRVSPSKSWLINKGCEAAGGGRVDATEQEIALVSVGLSLTSQELFVVSKTKSHEPQVSHRGRQIHCKSTGSTRTRSYTYTNISHVISIIQSRVHTTLQSCQRAPAQTLQASVSTLKVKVKAGLEGLQEKASPLWEEHGSTADVCRCSSWTAELLRRSGPDLSV